MLKKIITAFVLLSLSVASYAIDKILIESNHVTYFNAGEKFVVPVGQELDSDLILYDERSDKKLVIISTNPNTYRFSVQFQSNMYIENNGIDADGKEGEYKFIELADWKNCTSPWKIAKPLTGLVFEMPVVDDKDMQCFTSVAVEDIKQEVQKQAGDDWVGIFERGLATQGGFNPVSVDLSVVRFKIEVLVKGQWEHVTTLNGALPRGC